MTESDEDLLKRFVLQQSEEAFAELVHRYLPLVFSAALRQVRSRELAEEVSQAVFVELAQHASKLKAGTILSAWLYKVARNKAVDVVRHENRRQAREMLCLDTTIMTSEPDPWKEIEPHLDDAMETLKEEDRTAVMLRYFQSKSLREIGKALGASDNAAQKRISRALEQLNDFFLSRKLNVSAIGIGATISANAVQAAPSALAATITSAAMAGPTAVATTVIVMTTLQKAVFAATIVLAVGTGVYQTNKVSELTRQLEESTVRVLNTPAADTKQLEQTVAQMAALRAENERLRENTSELLRLRNEVGRLKTAAASLANPDAGEAVIKNWLAKVDLLQQRLQSSPQANIPDLQLLTQEDWLLAVKGEKLETEKDFRKVFGTLRNSAQNKLASTLQPALAKYATEHQGSYPQQVSELNAYLESPIDPAILQRYSIVPASEISGVKVGGDYAITVSTPVDAEYDKQIVIGRNGYGSASYKKGPEASQSDIDTLTSAFKAYTSAHGREPTHPADLKPFVTTGEQRSALERVLQARAESKQAE